MIRMTKKLKSNLIKGLALLSAGCFSYNFFVTSAQTGGEEASLLSMITKADTRLVNMNQEKFYDSNVIRKLPDEVSDNDILSVIVSMETQTVMDAYENSSTEDSFAQFVLSQEGKAVSKEVEKAKNNLVKKLNKANVDYTIGEVYDTILSGFEITIKAKDFEKVDMLLSDEATLIVGEKYAACETEVIHNYVEVYETGIFDSSKCDYQGDGVVVAVLDTGLDYTHTAFLESNFSPNKVAFTKEIVSEKVKETTAASYTSGLTGSDVYVSSKVPYAYDYADKDPDVFPINSEHGTHVAGVIAGNDDTITGVAPNAQLAIMKVFSDMQDGARTSWILAALEDCVVLGVDVINMSLGTSCGFAREIDEENVNVIYDEIKARGISLITAASNDHNSTYGSDKNGSNPLTSNPDSGTVGSPSTYAASLSVASVDGVKTPYMKWNDEIIYFTEASTSDADVKKKFVNDILGTLGSDVTSHDFTYVTIPGVGRSSDYPEKKEFYKGKIVLVKRGSTTFEEKVRVALKEKGAAGIIIYNNVSGTIGMQVGDNVGAVCSISQDYGEMLAKQGTGVISISKEQVAGPFMSDFSSWGPTSDLQIKPEITAHGGEILSAVPGQGYERLSGTSMAAPNQAGATALIRQYVKDYENIFGSLSAVEVTNVVNQLMMSTTDIVLNTNGLPYSVRKQGSGLVNIAKATKTQAYLTTFDKNGDVMDKTKLELGDDKKKEGVYTMSFAINNISEVNTTYNVDSMIMTEGVSPTYTSHGDRTSTQNGYLLDGMTTVQSVSGGQQSGNQVTVGAKQTAVVTVQVVLSEADKTYLDESFKHGMYVEGFITLDAVNGATVDLNVPMLAYYGDWTEAPIFDEEYYDTNKDELNSGLDAEDKLMADAYATEVIGGFYSDYIGVMGAYYFVQDPSATPIAADKNHIALSYKSDDYTSPYSSLEAIWAGLLRNCREIDISIVEDSTGRVVFSRQNFNQRKSYTYGGAIRQSGIDIDFSAAEYNLKNNTQYTVTVTSYIDYGTNEEQANARNTFEFPLYIDFEAPVVTDVSFRAEYDKKTKTNKLFADVSIYDNHYAMAMQVGQIVEETDPDTPYTMSMNSFGQYITPIYSNFNSTSVVSYELTDYIAQLKNSIGVNHEDSGMQMVKNNNSFIINCYDYAMNAATYEIRLPDEILALSFAEDEISLNPNETLSMYDILNVYPGNSWMELLKYESEAPDVVDVVNQTIIAKKSGEQAVIWATGYDANGNEVKDSIVIKVLQEGDEGYYGNYTLPKVNKFELTGYTTIKAYYGNSSDEREIGLTGGTYEFGNNYTLSMYPSEKVKLNYVLDSYFPEDTWVAYSGFEKDPNDPEPQIVNVSSNGTIEARVEGDVNVLLMVMDGEKEAGYTARVSITVKDPFKTNAIYLMSYKGLGGEVVIPDDRGITTIYSFAFSGYEYVDKDPAMGDVIDDEDPYLIKQWFIGDDTITKVVIPEGVTTIESYAFANLTALEEVVLPSTLTKIGVGAFYGCEKLSKITFSSKNNLQFINKQAFFGCNLSAIDLSSIVAIGNYAFEYCPLVDVKLPKSAQSLGEGAFAFNEKLERITFDAKWIKIGANVFTGCTLLESVEINADVIPAYAFYGCENLTNVRLGKDVKTIGEFAFAGTNVSKFSFWADGVTTNGTLTLKNDGKFLYNGTELVLSAPAYVGEYLNGRTRTVVIPNGTTSIGSGAFAMNRKAKLDSNGKPLLDSEGNVRYEYIRFVTEEKSAGEDGYIGVESIGAYAFAEGLELSEVSFASLTEIGDFAFYGTVLKATPDLSKVKTIGEFAFAFTNLESVNITSATKLVGDYAFAYNLDLTSVMLGDNVTVGEGAFYCPMYVYSYEQTGTLNPTQTGGLQYYDVYAYEVKDEDGNVVETYSYYRYNFSEFAYSSLHSLTIGNNVTLGDYAFAGSVKLENVTLGEGASIGDYAFYNAIKLAEIDLSTVTSIGESAFSGTYTLDLWKNDNVWNFAYAFSVVDGELVATDYKYSSCAPALTSVDLSALTYLGEGAFANNKSLTDVTFGENVNEVAGYAFMGTSALTTVNLPENITAIGDYAFYNSALANVSLEKIDTIGAGAFGITKLTSVTLKEGANLGDGAFAYCFDLVEVKNLEDVISIGANAFAYVGLEEVTLTSAEYIGDFAFVMSNVQKVVLGENLKSIGENPFYACLITTFGKETEVIFQGQTIGTELVETYDVSETVKVIDGVLYQVVDNGGLELVSYPLGKTDVTYAVEEGTVRISASAFAYASLYNVVLPSTLKAIGDKAFYGCAYLTTVTFTSYEAPILEEEYNEEILYKLLPYSGSYNGYVGLGISPYFMWSAINQYNNYYYGANFVSYVGTLSEYDKLVMVKPVNGKNYNTFIFSQYFGTTVEGSVAAVQATLTVIADIAKLPAIGSLSLEDTDWVRSLRAAYDALANDQKALVSNYDVLMQAESRIDYLNFNSNPVEPPVEEPKPEEKSGCGSVASISMSLVALAGAAVVVLLKKKKAD